MCSGPREEKDHPDCYQQQVQKPGSVMVWGCVSALGKGNLHFCDGTINAEKYIEILEHNMLPSRRHLFQGRPCIFQQDNAKPHSAHITKSWLWRKRVRVLDWPACSPDLSPIENVWRILKRKMRQRRPRTVAHLKGDLTHTVSPNLMLILSTYRVVLHPSYLQKVFSFIIFIKERYRFTILSEKSRAPGGVPCGRS